MDLCYFDNNATTRVDEEVFQEMMPYLRDSYGNASSAQHQLGRQANQAIEAARRRVASLLRAQPKELYFTSGATESINTVIRGVILRYRSKGKHIITCQTEHPAVLSACRAAEKEYGAQITYLPVDHNGHIDLEEFARCIRPDTVLVSMMAANNETGVLHPIAEIAAICQRNEVLFFCDATQWVGKLPLDLQEIPVDLLCLSAHKIHGPKGVGALFIRRRSKPIQIASLIQGGRQENGFRAGTYPVHQIVGLGAAAERARMGFPSSVLRDHFEEQMLAEIPEIEIHGQKVPRLPNTSHIHFRHVPASELMTKLPEIAVSTGSACVSGSRDPSHVLLAMGVDKDIAFNTLRFSFSSYTSREEIDRAITKLKMAVSHIRSLSPVWQMYREGLI